MPLWPAAPTSGNPPLISVATSAVAPFGALLHGTPGTLGDVALAAGTMLLYPVEIREPYTVVKGWWLNAQTAALAGSVQIAVYSKDFALLAASATVVQAGAAVLQEAAISPAVVIPRGVVYLAVVTSAAGAFTTYGSYGGSAAIALQLSKATGMLIASPVYPAPATISPIVSTAGIVPHAGISNRSLVV